ncbi:hypothetical protein JCM11491_007136 [Sporobolomyces phaffii]
MAAVVPRKRSTSPAPPTTDGDPLVSPTASKQPRLDASAPSSRAYKVPRQAAAGTQDSAPQPMKAEVAYLTTRFEVEDSSEYKEALLALEGLIGRSAYPTRQHIRQVLALCFFPLLFKPPIRISAFARATSSASAHSKALLAPFDPDPFHPSHKKLRDEARKVLDDVIATNGADVVCRAIKGYGLPKPTSTAELDDPFASSAPSARTRPSDLPLTPASYAGGRNPKVVKGKGKGKAREAAAAKAHASDDEDLASSDTDDALASSAKRIAKSDTLWDVLAGTTAKKPRVWTRERPVVEGGWEVLRCLVDGWEVESEKKRRAAHADDAPVQQLSLLRYFKPSATSITARELSSRAFDLAFWPFSDAASPASEADSDGSDQDSHEDDLFSDADKNVTGYGLAKKRRREKEKAKKEDDEVSFEGGMSLEEKRVVGIRLLCLVGDSATAGHFDATATLGEFVQRMKGLEHSNFQTFLELLSLHSSPTSPFLSRLLAAYLETLSHPLAANAALNIPSLATLSTSILASSSSSDLLTSPRKRALAAQSSMASVSGDDPSHSQGLAASQRSEAEVEAEFWKTPRADSRDFLNLMSRIPIEVQLPVDETVTTPPGGGARGGRKPKSAVVTSFGRAERAAECHRLVKEALVACKLDDGTVGPESREERDKWVGKIQTVLEGVDEAVDQARERIHKK